MPGPIPQQAQAPQAAPAQQAPAPQGGGAQQLVSDTHDNLAQLAKAAGKSNPQAAEAFGAALSALEQAVELLQGGGQPPQGPSTPEAGAAQVRPAL
jgi:hypothetical protein